MNQDLNIVHLIANASLVVKLVILLLLIGSVASWTVIFRKWFALRRARAKTEDFEQAFWAGN